MSERSIAVMTLHNSPNYGSCLQTFATQSVLNGLGLNTQVVDYYRYDAIPEHETDRALNGQLVKKMPIFRLPGVKSLARIPVSRIVARRAAPLNEFRKTRLHLSTRKYYSVEELENDPPQADIYCTGSDQVWNSIWNKGFNKAFYLSFAPESAKRIAYASSIGKESLEDWEKAPMREALLKYSHISVREEEAVELLDDIGIHGAVPVIDPTLMLDRAAWGNIASKALVPNQPYILIYQLNKNSEFDQYAQKLSKKLQLPIYRIAYGIHEKRKGEHIIVCPRVEEFLGLFMNAEYVLTDSFHGTAFSLNLGRKFVAISPGRFSGRIMNLLRLTNMENRYLKDYRDLGIVDQTFNFTYAQSTFSHKRKEAEDFLSKAINE